MRRRRKKQRKAKFYKGRRSGKNDGPVFFKNPLSDIPRDQLRLALVKHAAESAGTFKTVLADVMAILKEHEPLQVLCMLSSYGLTAAMDQAGQQTPLAKETEIIQSHVEFAQALALTVPERDLNDKPADAPTLQKLLDLLPQLGRAFADQRYAALSKDRDEAEQAILALQEYLRLHTQHVRNWGYFDKVLRVVIDLYAPLDSAITAKLGLSVSDIVSVFVAHLRSFEKHNTSRLLALRQIWKRSTAAQRIREYYKIYPELQDKPEDLIAFATQHSLDANQAMGLIWAHLDFRATEHCMMHSRAVAAALGTNADVVERVLDRLSIRLGELEGKNIEHLFLDNPVWLRPLIRISNERYFCAMPQMFFSFVRPILDELITDDAALVQAVADRRAVFLESEVARLFATAFPGAEISTGFRWRYGGTEYENDLLVRVDSHLFLVEAKSGIVSAPALRGAPERAKKHIRELIVEPSQQSARLADRINTALASPQLQAQYLPEIGIDLTRVKRVVRLSVTLEDFGTVQTNLHELRHTSWIPADHNLAPCILLTDLEIIFDVLESAGEKINYLKRRAELAESMRTIGDELDHLGLYLKTGFNIGGLESGSAILQLDRMSQLVDDYYVAFAEGVRRPKPKLRISKWWSDICKFVDQRSFWRWSEVINILLSFSLEEQEQAERMFGQIKSRHRKDRNARSQDTVFVCPPTRKSEAIALFAFRDSDGEQRHQKMEQIAGQTFDTAHVKRCLVIAVNVDRHGYPYSTLMVFDRSQATPSVAELQ